MLASDSGFTNPNCHFMLAYSLYEFSLIGPCMQVTDVHTETTLRVLPWVHSLRGTCAMTRYGQIRGGLLRASTAFTQCARDIAKIEAEY
jgi:hypothetical protein